MRSIRMSSAITTIQSSPELVVEDRLSELLTLCIRDLNDWETCGKFITEQLEFHCFISKNNSEVALFENKLMRIFYCLNTKKTRLEITISDVNVVKMFINISKIKRLDDLSGKLKGKEYPFEIFKYGDKKRAVISTKLLVDTTTIVNNKSILLRLGEL